METVARLSKLNNRIPKQHGKDKMGRTKHHPVSRVHKRFSALGSVGKGGPLASHHGTGVLPWSRWHAQEQRGTREAA